MPQGSDLTGAVLEGRYQVLERMAEGAMGVVYRGLRTNLNRAVAIKVMHAALPGAMAGRERFEREAKLMALLDHPHCVSVIDYGIHGEKPFVVMELVRGRSLHDLINENNRFEIPRAAEIVRQVLSGLAHAHEQGIIHRDVKPANIMITPKAPLGVHARILDFGLARVCAASASITDGMAVGTPSYMAPEQCRGERVDERADLYACGVVLFELVTGRKPFVAADPIAIIKKHLEEPPPRLADVLPGDHGALEAVVARALAKRPEDRFTSAVAMAEAIDAAIEGRSAEATGSFGEQELGESDVVPVPSSVQVPITIDSAVLPAGESGARTGVHDPHERSMLRRMLPVSRLRWFVFASILFLGSAAAAIYVMFVMDRAPAASPAPVPVVTAPVHDTAPVAVEPPPAPAHPAAAVEAYEAGKDFFAKMWWVDGIKSFRRAIELDPSYRTDDALLAAAARGFATTPGYDDRLASFVLFLGAPVLPYLDEVARSRRSPEVKARCAALARRLR